MEKINLLKVGSEKNQLQLNLSSYNDRPLLELRNYYLSKDSNEMLPTKKGLSLAKDKYIQLKKSLDDNDDIIIDHFSGCEIVAKIEKTENKKIEALSSHANGIKKVKFSFEDIENSDEYLKLDYKGSEVLIVFNSSTEIGQDLLEMQEQDSKFFRRVCNLIAAYEVSKIISLSGMEEDYSFVSDYMKHDFKIIYKSLTND